MPKCRLRSYEIVVPGGFPYAQRYPGGVKEFPSLPVIETQAQAVAAFRKGNGLPRATTKEALIDVDRYTAFRLGCHNTYTVPVDAATGQLVAANPAVSPTITPCKGCGGQVLAG